MIEFDVGDEAAAGLSWLSPRSSSTLTQLGATPTKQMSGSHHVAARDRDQSQKVHSHRPVVVGSCEAAFVSSDSECSIESIKTKKSRKRVAETAAADNDDLSGLVASAGAKTQKTPASTKSVADAGTSNSKPIAAISSKQKNQKKKQKKNQDINDAALSRLDETQEEAHNAFDRRTLSDSPDDIDLPAFPQSRNSSLSFVGLNSKRHRQLLLSQGEGVTGSEDSSADHDVSEEGTTLHAAERRSKKHNLQTADQRQDARTQTRDGDTDSVTSGRSNSTNSKSRQEDNGATIVDDRLSDEDIQAATDAGPSESPQSSATAADSRIAERTEAKVKRCLQILAPLMQPMDRRPESALPPSRLEQMLHAFEELWTCSDPCGSFDDTIKEMSLTVELCLGLKGKTATLPPQLEDIIDMRLQEPVWNLRARLLQAGMMHNPKFKHSEIIAHKLGTMYIKQVSAVEAYYNAVCYKCSNFDFHLDVQNPDVTLGILRYLPATEVQKSPEYFRFLVYCLNICQRRRYRRLGADIYRPKYTSEGWFTNAYERKCSIQEWVWGCVDADRSFHMFKAAHSKRSLCEPIAKCLELLTTPYFPKLQENRYLSSWRNGVWHHGQDKFFPYSKKQRWDCGVRPDPQPITVDLSQTVSTLEQLCTTLPKWKSVFECIKQDVQKHVAESNDPNDNNNNSSASSDHQEDDDNLYLGNPFASSIYIDQEFVPCDPSRINPDGTYRKGYWRDIPTAYFDELLRSQDFKQDTIDWICALLGRALYTCGDLNNENWNVAMLLLGYSGTGKSTILKLLRKFFKTENIGVLSNNIERQWAMHSLVGKHVVIGYELKRDFKWDQAEFQQCAACEESLVFKKHADAYISQFRSHIIMACNEMIRAWRDNSGSLRRRLVVVLFRNFIPPHKVNPKLMEYLEAEFPFFVQKINKAYREMATLYSGVDIWSVLGEELQQANKNTMTSVHPLQDFFCKMDQQELLVKESSAYCKWDEFMTEFKAFCDKENIEYRKIQWHEEFWRPVFETQGLKVNLEMRYDAARGEDVKAKWISGLQFLHPDSRSSSTMNNYYRVSPPNQDVHLAASRGLPHNSHNNNYHHTTTTVVGNSTL